MKKKTKKLMLSLLLASMAVSVFLPLTMTSWIF